NDFSPMLAFMLLAAVAVTLVAAVLAVLAAAGIVGAVAGIVVACVFAVALATMCLHLVMAIVVWTRRPRTRVWMSKRWWGFMTLFVGLFAAVPFWWLHYVRAAVARCHKCGYDLTGRAKATA